MFPPVLVGVVWAFLEGRKEGLSAGERSWFSYRNRNISMSVSVSATYSWYGAT